MKRPYIRPVQYKELFRHMETKNIMIVGVGGQGSLLASKLLGHLLMEQGFDVKVRSEEHTSELQSH